MERRLELVHQLLRECILSAGTVASYLDTPRRYNAAGADDLYMREVHFVVAIGPENSISMSELTERLGVTQGAVSQMAARLEKKGYVERRQSETDRRIKLIRLTEKGEKLCSDHIAYDLDRYKFADSILKNYSDEDLEALIKYEHIVRQLFTN